MSWFEYSERQGPPEEAYSRVTNPERFEPLVQAGLDLLDRLVNGFDVDHEVGYGLDAELEHDDAVLPTWRLVPRDPAAAPLTMAFSSFPGLRVRFGSRLVRAYPGCGCDACGETADGEAARLADMVGALTAGRFRESVELDGNEAWYVVHIAGLSWEESGKTRIERDRVQGMPDAGQVAGTVQWRLWPRRS